ncbi:MAG: hypothetical protein JRD47_00555 [Deltaproteobacteria bacterium]|nr:hypothetical protein [Deltaproteobacteria bacterium]MBW2317207.1 hypothetical protein [Deltaproteobacteria bacterium]MBW2600410.1 hypothetical protein [Deltaproteobacteria bacterium]OEU46870.1 MAG: hypothetical protein BBJ60_10090 [Desulfobacterales bacterium S7086C20]
MKKGFILFLVLMGLVLGYWMARENRELFELPHDSGSSQDQVLHGTIDVRELERGMDTWQVKELFGSPDARRVLADTGETKKEEWKYGERYLYFRDGFLSSWKE